MWDLDKTNYSISAQLVLFNTNQCKIQAQKFWSFAVSLIRKVLKTMRDFYTCFQIYYNTNQLL